MKISIRALTLVMGLSGMGTLGLADAATATTTVDVNLRRLPSTQTEVLQVVPQGTLLTVACRGEWCRTTYRGRGGYVARAMTRPLTGSAPLAGPSTVYYASCAALRAAGATPVQLGKPGYRLALDSNRNNVACDGGDR